MNEKSGVLCTSVYVLLQSFTMLALWLICFFKKKKKIQHNQAGVITCQGEIWLTEQRM